MLAIVFSALRAIPFWIYIVAACLAWGAYQRFLAASSANKLHQAQIEAAAEREQATQAALVETNRRLAAQAAIARDADERKAIADLDAAASLRAADKLRKQLAAIRASVAASNPAAASASQTDRLAEVLGACADRYRDVATVADRAIISGRACERAYEALVPQPAGEMRPHTTEGAQSGNSN